jgi:crossover junction endodeoxyribonuclease RusA
MPRQVTAPGALGARGRARGREVDVIIRLSWPVESSLNSRIHWAKRAEINSANELEGWTAAKVANNGEMPPGEYSASIKFHPPDKRRRDLDNLLARVKKQLDGACRAWGLDDSAIKRITLEWGEMRYHGEVLIEIDAL